MRILQLGKAYPPANLGGVEFTIQLITEGLHKENIECDVLGVNDNFSSVIDYTAGGIIYRSALIKKAFSTLFSLDLIKNLNKIQGKYDIIHVHHPDPMCALALWMTRPKCKIILHWHSDILKQKWLLKLYRPIQTWLINRANIIIATSPNYAGSSVPLAKSLSKIRIVPIGIDKTRLNFDTKIVESIVDMYQGKKKLLCIGRMTYYKGYDYLIDSLSILDDSYVLFIIGEGELGKDLKEKVRSKELMHKVVFLGKVKDIVRNSYLKCCDLFVLSSIYKTEAFAIVQVEAMALGKPVISTIIPGSGVDWVNKDMDSGLTVPIRDSNSIAKAIQNVMTDINLYRRLTTGAEKRYLQEFTQEKMSLRLIEIYNSVLNIT